MAEDHPGLVAKIAIFNMEIGMANATALHLQQRFTMFERA
ncbi:Uncharacterised protein [Enterobacter cloacae]|nr:Uncharacterised protein [Enterobacter cloacae]